MSRTHYLIRLTASKYLLPGDTSKAADGNCILSVLAPASHQLTLEGLPQRKNRRSPAHPPSSTPPTKALADSDISRHAETSPSKCLLSSLINLARILADIWLEPEDYQPHLLE